MFQQKIKEATMGQWIKFSIVVFFVLLFFIWHGNPAILLSLILFFDIYITRFIPWTWWKKAKNKTLRTVMEWIDAILFALIAVYFINLYLFQNYKIPTSSLEKTLLVGDHLFVSKIAYGARTPNTPFSFPLVQHTFPWGTKSYIEGIQWESRRLAGLRNVERGDIVVFNFPAGDTVVSNMQAVDYESICYGIGKEKLEQKNLNLDSLKSSSIDVRSLCLSIGQKVIKSNPQQYGELLYRPVDRRENYVKRCVAIAGDTIEIRNREIFINGKKQDRPNGVQHYCEIASKTTITQDLLDQLSISKEASEHSYMGQTEDGLHIYLIPLTESDQKYLSSLSTIVKVEEHNIEDLTSQRSAMYPMGYNLNWTTDNYGPIYLPKSGDTISLSLENLALYERIIRNYEGNTLAVRNNEILINNIPTKEYIIKQNYYWMMGDNRHNSADSRMWGPVPEDHIVGQPLFVWLSLNPDKNLFDGGIRWNRFFKGAKK